MEDIINKGVAEPAPAIRGGETVWYIPDHEVSHPQKPDQLRVMFDCSAKFCSISLNNTLLTGPGLINSLVGVLCHFRKKLFTVTCDRRFLWWQGGDLESQDYCMSVHLFSTTLFPVLITSLITHQPQYLLERTSM